MWNEKKLVEWNGNGIENYYSSWNGMKVESKLVEWNGNGINFFRIYCNIAGNIYL